ncbi:MULTISPECIES: hypothetical protein [Rhodococcus]|uniref:Lipoprotein n=2 Tax=Rhodococcus opacus TaxID=37919 RepID=C1BCU2_RHOOB|nr:MULTISPECIES: hypothetical protein [Rhodococcus]EID81393.1 hypothetical protein W59_03936 [Rhodococcus opacus RKJ300 = JCM 13270]KAF0958982.1 hypothetical protein MLGJGCBP_07941 [Rhodococcus sp. T7]QQZ19183.1 hypothetical protein GO592_37730 [Rhodococcus sp. 21391]UOT07951.1 hypothetical protein MPY17_36800 [Rhodococcus opacus]BAH55686.1 hypothetical protein ROP_pROB01-01870 [Rhodococcus opacus B4]
MKHIGNRAGTALRTGLLAVVLVMVTVSCSQNPPPISPGQSTAPNATAPESNPAGDIPDNQVYVPFTPAGDRFTISVPEGWSRSTAGTETVFTDKYNTVRVQAGDRAAAPTVESVISQELPGIAAGTPGYRAGTVTAVQRRAGQAVLITYQAASAPNPVTGKSVTEAVERYQFWHNGTEVVVTLSGPQGTDNVDPWRTITDSLQWP